MDKQCTVQVKLELGHHAQLRQKPTTEGFTHDWMVFVRGAEQCEIQHFVEKVVFRLHDSFPKPKRVCKEPPYKVEESGYAGFIMPIEVYFKNKEEPRKVCFTYDLFLNLEGNPPVNHLRCEKLTFNNPTLEFRCKLLMAGGVMVMPEGAETLSRPSPDYPMLPTIPLSAFSDPKKTKLGHSSKDTKMTLKEPKLERLSPKGGSPPKASGKRPVPADLPKPRAKKPKSCCKNSWGRPAASPQASASASSFPDKKPAKDEGRGKGGYKGKAESNPHLAKKVPNMEESNSEDKASFKTEKKKTPPKRERKPSGSSSQRKS